ncbi:hypothetical protein EMO92_09985 [Bifidobacterium reuteri]|uniref:Nuclease SbcCD subunit C n=1 Tax=Bifidobacterium reuteri TaxID=983706 RepID=A0A5J5E2S8_9BIFI|nr:AAA family ATPase [Bifidobacterium reuteri]KAA8823499.1 hypothetical protein EMO92_09985 [Bifidobacterium reuteri]
MKLIGMKFQGVGPYKGEFAIDFAALTSSHMFLIEGQTGAGKTTILDCLTFALYGGTSGATSSSEETESKQRFRSRFLMNSRTETYVDLIFKSGDDYYEVRRTPSYRQPKANGDGFTEHSSKVKLMRIDRGLSELIAAGGNNPNRYFRYAEEPGHQEEVTSRDREAGIQIAGLIGLDRKQFSRTIMLAQGQFYAFLQMKPEDRTGLVKDLLGAEIYQHIQDDLKEQRKTSQAALNSSIATLQSDIKYARNTASHIAKSARSQSDEGDESEYDSHSPIWSNAQWGVNEDGRLDYPARTAREIQTTIDATAAEVDAILSQWQQQDKTLQNQAKEQYDQKKSQREAVEALHKCSDLEQRRLRSLLALEDQRQSMEAAAETLQRSRLAKPIKQKQDELAEHAEKRDGQEALLNRTQKELASYSDDIETMELQYETAIKASQGAIAARLELKQADEHDRLVDKAEESKERHEQALKQLAEAQALLKRRNAECSRLPHVEDIDAEIQNANKSIGTKTGLEKDRNEANTMLEHARTAQQIENQIPRYEQQLRQAEADEREAQNTLDAMRQLADESGAAKYADNLEEGIPCPVCGSEHHPHPAVKPQSVPSNKEINALKNRCTEKTEAKQKADKDLQQLKDKLDSERSLARNMTIEQARLRVERLTQQIDNLNKVADNLEELYQRKKAIATAKTELENAKNTVSMAQERVQTAHERMESDEKQSQGHTHESVQSDRATAQHQLNEALKQGKLAEQLKQRIKKYKELLDQKLTQQTGLDKMNTDIKTLNRQLDDMLRQSPFHSLEEATRSYLGEQAERDLDNQVSAHERQVIEAKTNLNSARHEFRSIIMGMGADMRHTLRIANATMDTLAADSRGDDNSTTGALAYTGDGSGGVITTELGKSINALDVEWFSNQEEIAENELHEAHNASGQIASIQSEWEANVNWLRNHIRQWRSDVQRFEPLQRMSGLTNADQYSPSASKRKMSLITFAVTERFRDVLDRANDLLSDIQGGIYELRLDQNADSGTGGVTKMGLAITVFDRRTEQERNPATLSGGETFFVSLALALALADIIQAENGGISMDTLFVDEGFGTLSEDYLADVMDMLHHIARKRDIGIISHVGFLKGQIAERISVSRVTPDGESRLEVLA